MALYYLILHFEGLFADFPIPPIRLSLKKLDAVLIRKDVTLGAVEVSKLSQHPNIYYA